MVAILSNPVRLDMMDWRLPALKIEWLLQRSATASELTYERCQRTRLVRQHVSAHLVPVADGARVWLRRVRRQGVPGVGTITSATVYGPTKPEAFVTFSGLAMPANQFVQESLEGAAPQRTRAVGHVQGAQWYGRTPLRPVTRATPSAQRSPTPATGSSVGSCSLAKPGGRASFYREPGGNALRPLSSLSRLTGLPS